MGSCDRHTLVLSPLPRTVSVEQSSITTRLRAVRRERAGVRGDRCSPRFVTPSSPLADAFLHTPPHPALSRRNWRGSASDTRANTKRSGERGRELSAVLKQPDDAYLGGRTAGRTPNLRIDNALAAFAGRRGGARCARGMEKLSDFQKPFNLFCRGFDLRMIGTEVLQQLAFSNLQLQQVGILRPKL